MGNISDEFEGMLQELIFILPLHPRVFKDKENTRYLMYNSRLYNIGELLSYKHYWLFNYTILTA
jgi:hypothetical protein